MSSKVRKIFVVVASGGHETEKHFQDTILRRHTLDEFANYLTEKEVSEIKSKFHNGPFAVWGATPGTSNARNWENMDQGDYVLIYRSKKIIFAAEVAYKFVNKDLAKRFWGEDENKNTWEFMYLLINAIEVDVDMSLFNKYVSYKSNYLPQGFMAIEQTKATSLLTDYGDLLSALTLLQQGRELEHAVKSSPQGQQLSPEEIEEKIARAPTEHDEIQWRLIRMGNNANVNVWVPRNDQNKHYQDNNFKEHVLDDFEETIDVPTYVKNIDVVWKYGKSIKSAFEIEHSTSIYSGILRLSDLRALTPNSNYPLFIVADRNRRSKVFDELNRPTFNNPFLKLHEVINYLSYDTIRDLDEKNTHHDANLSLDFLTTLSEKPIIKDK